MPLKVFGGSLLLPLRIDRYEFDRLPYQKSIDERVSTQLSDQLPDFIVSNYETFVQFLTAYYEWMELEGNPRYEAVKLGTYNDIDETIDDFLSYFKSTYLVDMPIDLVDGINEKTLAKQATDLYRSKGTKASFDLLFRILFNTTISVSYPRDKILRLSKSTFDDRKYLRIEPVMSIDEALESQNALVVQRSSDGKNITGTALIDDIEFKQKNGLDFFSLSVQDVSGSFNDQTPVKITLTGATAASYTCRLFSTMVGVNIVNGGADFEIDDQVFAFDPNGNLLLSAIVKSIGPRGDIRSLRYIDNYGVFIGDTGITYSFVTNAGNGAEFTAKSGQVLADKPDTYADESGKISSRAFIQDNYYYQDFSYIIRVDQALQKYADAVKKLVHPSGFLLFGEYLNNSSISTATSITSEHFIRFQPIIGHYLPHTFGTTIDPRGFTFTTVAGSTFTDFYPTGYNGQDGRTFGDFLGITLANARYGTPHLYMDSISDGITHDPYSIYDSSDSQIVFDDLETEETLLNGAFGSTGYIGMTTDSSGEYAGLLGFFPVGSDRTSALDPAYGSGVTHYGGYVSPNTTTIYGGYSGGQIIQVQGTDSISADYWIVYRHPAHLGLSDLGLTGERQRIRIPLLPVISGSTAETTDPLNGGATYTIGEIVRQKYSHAIGIVVDFIASSYDHNSMFRTGHPPTTEFLPYANPMYNVGIDTLVVDVLNGKFVPSYDRVPIIGDDSTASRLTSSDFDSSDINTGNTYDTSWMEIPIELMVNEITYSNVTN